MRLMLMLSRDHIPECTAVTALDTENWLKYRGVYRFYMLCWDQKSDNGVGDLGKVVRRDQRRLVGLGLHSFSFLAHISRNQCIICV